MHWHRQMRNRNAIYFQILKEIENWEYQRSVRQIQFSFFFGDVINFGILMPGNYHVMFTTPNILAIDSSSDCDSRSQMSLVHKLLTLSLILFWIYDDSTIVWFECLILALLKTVCFWRLSGDILVFGKDITTNLLYYGKPFLWTIHWTYQL